jgi:fatty acid desaturase
MKHASARAPFALVRLREESVPPEKTHARMAQLIWTLMVILFILWLVGWLVFHLIGWSIHILLVVAVILLIVNLLRNRGSAP